jgi:DNA-binding MarR family transcriptional regulator
MNNSTVTAATSSLVDSLIQLARRLEEGIEEALATVDLSAARFGVLDQLVRADRPLALSELAARLCCVRSNMTQLVDRLELDGLVSRVADPHDRRCIRAELTALGREKQAAGAAQILRIHTLVEEALSPRERESARKALARLDTPRQALGPRRRDGLGAVEPPHHPR